MGISNDEVVNKYYLNKWACYLLKVNRYLEIDNNV
jgi:hypothetical protein